MLYDISVLIPRRPLTTDRQSWTRDQKHVVSTLKDCWCAAYWDGAGSDEEWEQLQPLFAEDGTYLGI